VLEARLALANQLDDQRLRTNDPGILQELDKQLLPYDEIMSQEWFLQTKTIRLPQLTDFLTIERAEYHLRNIRQLEDREYDEKFHVLQAPSLLLSDLNYFRVKCAMRNLPLVIAFVDIDDFKSFNIEHGETNVDLYLLPPFMRALEAVVYGRGFAYRLGGDEYAVLIPNTHKSAGAEIIRDFQRGIAQIDYVGVQKRPTVSVGFCEVLADGVLTGRELVIRAEKAKTFAKQGGKNRIATYSDSSCEHLELLPPN